MTRRDPAMPRIPGRKADGSFLEIDEDYLDLDWRQLQKRVIRIVTVVKYASDPEGSQFAVAKKFRYRIIEHRKAKMIGRYGTVSAATLARRYRKISH